jgi:hypothetical protein
LADKPFPDGFSNPAKGGRSHHSGARGSGWIDARVHWSKPQFITAILILAKSYSTARNRGMVMPSERAKRARAVERAGFI